MYVCKVYKKIDDNNNNNEKNIEIPTAKTLHVKTCNIISNSSYSETL